MLNEPLRTTLAEVAQALSAAYRQYADQSQRPLPYQVTAHVLDTWGRASPENDDWLSGSEGAAALKELLEFVRPRDRKGEWARMLLSYSDANLNLDRRNHELTVGSLALPILTPWQRLCLTLLREFQKPEFEDPQDEDLNETLREVVGELGTSEEALCAFRDERIIRAIQADIRGWVGTGTDQGKDDVFSGTVPERFRERLLNDEEAREALAHIGVNVETCLAADVAETYAVEREGKGDQHGAEIARLVASLISSSEVEPQWLLPSDWPALREELARQNTEMLARLIEDTHLVRVYVTLLYEAPSAEALDAWRTRIERNYWDPFRRAVLEPNPPMAPHEDVPNPETRWLVNGFHLIAAVCTLAQPDTPLPEVPGRYDRLFANEDDILDGRNPMDALQEAVLALDAEAFRLAARSNAYLWNDVAADFLCDPPPENPLAPRIVGLPETTTLHETYRRRCRDRLDDLLRTDASVKAHALVHLTDELLSPGGITPRLRGFDFLSLNRDGLIQTYAQTNLAVLEHVPTGSMLRFMLMNKGRFPAAPSSESQPPARYACLAEQPNDTVKAIEAQPGSQAWEIWYEPDPQCTYLVSGRPTDDGRGHTGDPSTTQDFTAIVWNRTHGRTEARWWGRTDPETFGAQIPQIRLASRYYRDAWMPLRPFLADYIPLLVDQQYEALRTVIGTLPEGEVLALDVARDLAGGTAQVTHLLKDFRVTREKLSELLEAFLNGDADLMSQPLERRVPKRPRQRAPRGELLRILFFRTVTPARAWLVLTVLLVGGAAGYVAWASRSVEQRRQPTTPTIINPGLEVVRNHLGLTDMGNGCYISAHPVSYNRFTRIMGEPLQTENVRAGGSSNPWVRHATFGEACEFCRRYTDYVRAKYPAIFDEGEDLQGYAFRLPTVEEAAANSANLRPNNTTDAEWVLRGVTEAHPDGDPGQTVFGPRPARPFGGGETKPETRPATEGKTTFRIVLAPDRERTE